MKYSIFNSIIIVEDRHTLLFNSYSGKFITIRKNIYNLHNIDIDEMKLTHPNLHRQLCEAGMIIKDDVDEVKLLQDRINRADNNNGEFILHINPTLDCNFNCWYCYENHISHSSMSEDVIQSTLSFISNVLDNQGIKSLDLGFFGGEPLMHFDRIARPIIEYSQTLCNRYKKNLHVHFTSNGSLLNDRMISYLSSFSCGFQITLDGGKEWHDRTRYFRNGMGSYDKIVQNIIKLLVSNIGVIVRVNYTRQNIDSVYSILESFSKVPYDDRERLRFDFQRVWQDSNCRSDETESKASRIREGFRKDGYTVIPNYIPNDVRNSCYGDKKNHVLINYNGLAFGCTARDFTEGNSLGKLEKTGVILYDKEKMTHREHAKFSKAICRQCRIAPICGGGCKQKAWENMDSDTCTQHYSEKDMDDIILDIFEYSFRLKTEKS